jgi:hypothetical protein
MVTIPTRRDLITSAAAGAAVAALLPVVAEAEAVGPLQRLIAEHDAVNADYCKACKGGDPAEEVEEAFLDKVEEIEGEIIAAEPESKADLVALLAFVRRHPLVNSELQETTLDKALRFLTAGGAA